MRPLLLSAYGSLNCNAAADYAAIDEAIAAAFPNRERQWCWTSSAVLEGLRDRGQPAPSVADGLSALTDPLVVSIHLGPGAMHRGLVEQAGAATPPLLEGEDGARAAAHALLTGLDSEVINVIVGHGSKRAAGLNQAYLPVIDEFSRLVDPTVTWDWGTFDGPPGDGVCDRLRPTVAGGAVHFLPLLLVSGGHVADDLQGHDEDSWGVRMGATSTTVAPALARFPAIHQLLIDRINRADAE